MEIRNTVITDAPHLAEVSVATTKSTYTGIFPDEYLNSLSVESMTATWERRLSQKDKDIFFLTVVTDNGTLIGYTSGLPERTGNRLYTGEIGELYLLKEYQRQGIGRILMAAVAERLEKLGHDSALVWCISTNPYRAFYEAMGGQPVDTREKQRAGIMVPETAYGWRNLNKLIRILEQGDRLR